MLRNNRTDKKTSSMNLSDEEWRVIYRWRKAKKTDLEGWPRAMRRLAEIDANPKRKAEIERLRCEPAFEREWDGQDVFGGGSPEYVAWTLRFDRVLRDRQKELTADFSL